MKSIYSLDEAKKLIEENRNLIIAAHQDLLNDLPKGNWIGGTIPYFLGEEGGFSSKEKLFITNLPSICHLKSINQYDVGSLNNIMKDYPENGFSYVLIPATSEAHIKFANEVTTYQSLFNSPLLGWITGVHLDDLESEKPLVFNGLTGESSESDALVFHIEIDTEYYPKTEIINLFKQGSGDSIKFLNDGFEIKDALINGQKVNFAEYLNKKEINSELPLVANYSGAMVNASFQNINTEAKTVNLYAPVFTNVEYKIASPIENYKEEFEKIIQQRNIQPIFSCNCILNYLYAGLEGKRLGGITGPITFGEIAYILLNQTMVYLTLEKK